MSDADQNASKLEHQLLKFLNGPCASNASVMSDNAPQTQKHRVKVSRGSVRAFVDGSDLVRRGIRYVYISVQFGSRGRVNGPRRLL